MTAANLTTSNQDFALALRWLTTLVKERDRALPWQPDQRQACTLAIHAARRSLFAATTGYVIDELDTDVIPDVKPEGPALYWLQPASLDVTLLGGSALMSAAAKSQLSARYLPTQGNTWPGQMWRSIGDADALCWVDAAGLLHFSAIVVMP